jgi:hypothetical protein
MKHMAERKVPEPHVFDSTERRLGLCDWIMKRAHVLFHPMKGAPGPVPHMELRLTHVPYGDEDTCYSARVRVVPQDELEGWEGEPEDGTNPPPEFEVEGAGGSAEEALQCLMDVLTRTYVIAGDEKTTDA